MNAEPTLLAGDCLDRLRALPDASVHAVITDPPYGLANTTPTQVAETVGRWVAGDREHVPTGRGFMGKPWDAFVPPPAVWDECRRVLTPGGHLLAFAGSRTVDLMGLSIRLAGLDVRDGLVWLYGSGFPKSLDVARALERGGHDAQTWRGWGTALKPSQEPMVLARRPMDGTVAASVVEHGTGALNVDATRSGGETGRWPANALLDGHAANEVDRQGGWTASAAQDMELPTRPGFSGTTFGDVTAPTASSVRGHDDAGGASRFFPVFRYEAKAPTAERPVVDGVAHPTVKPLALMRWLVRLLTPPGGVVLDPFMGSGTTVEAALAEGFRVVGVEREPTYMPLVRARVERQAAAARRVSAQLGAEPLFDLPQQPGEGDWT